MSRPDSRKKRCLPRVEGLEGSPLMAFSALTAPSAAFNNPSAIQLSLTGTGGNEAVTVTDKGGGNVQVSQNGTVASYANVDSVHINGGAGNDTIVYKVPAGVT